MDGVLVIDKPLGPTSHDIVASVRSGLNIEKVGHTGTLDPMATGVLPLVLGRGTKLARYLTGSQKTYMATVCLGVTTETLDAEGAVVLQRPVNVTEADIDRVLAQFRGEIDQVPPMYSAKKIDGKKLYQLARQGVEVAREPKKVTISSLVRGAYTAPELQFEVTCTAGTYVRVLAQDIGEALGCGGYLKALRRTAAGPFALHQAITLEAALADPAAALTQVVPLSQALVELPRIDVPADIGRMLMAGHQLSVADLRVLDTPEFGLDEALTVGLDGGEVIAVARSQMASEEMPRSRRDRRALKTERVLSAR
jgi:tRNA pseudouridine55 synthase